MITHDRYLVQFMDDVWAFSTTLTTNDLQRAKKFCAATVAYHPNAKKGRVLDLSILRGEFPDDRIIYSVDNEREARKQLRTLLEVG